MAAEAIARRLSGLALACLVAASALADEGRSRDTFMFQRIGEAAGVTPNVITTLFRDRRGLLWVGSREGLYLFDGYSARRIAPDPDDPESISDTSIRTIYQDRGGALWFGTNTGGLCRLAPGGSAFDCLRPEIGRESSLSNESVYALAEDSDGALWVGTQVGLNRIDDGTVERVPFDEDHPEGPGREYVTALHFDAAGRLWVATVGRGVFLRDAPGEPFRSAASLGFDDPSAFSFLAGRDGELWVGGSRDVFRLAPGAGRFERIDLLPATEEGDVSVTSLIELPGGTVLAASFGRGLFEIDPDSLSVARHGSAPGDPLSLGDDRVTALLMDPGGGLLVSTWGAGMQRTTPQSRLFGGIRQFVDSKGVLSQVADVESIDGNDRLGIWAGSLSNGLLSISEGRTGLELVSVPVGDLTETPSVVAVYPEETGQVWVGSTTGLVRVDAGSLAVHRYFDDEGAPSPFGANWLTRFVRDGSGALWIGTGGGGLWRMDAGGGLTGFAHAADDPSSLSGDYVTALVLESPDVLWVGTRSLGLNRCRTEPFSCRRHDPADGAALRHHYVTAIHRDGDGAWWVGTAGGGLHRAERATDGEITGFTPFGIEQGLLDSTVMAFVEDDDGSLWIATRRGLSRFAPDRSGFANYLVSDGLVSDVFNRNAATRDSQRLYFGAVDGIVHLPAGTPFERPQAAPLAFTGAANLTTGASYIGLNGLAPRITAPHGQVLQFRFAVLDYEPGTHQYAYRLDPGSDWTRLDTSRQITFGDLPPGQHTLEVQGRSARGTLARASVPIEIVPPIWMTDWFRVLVVLALLASAIGIHRIRTASLQRRHRELQQLHQQRERALEQLQRSESELSEAAEGLRRLASRLETAKEEERQHISRELHDELGQTLTATKINLRLLQKQDGERGERLQPAVDMMDRMIAQVRAISLDLRPPLLDEAGLIPALKSELRQVADRTAMDIRLEVADGFPALPPTIETVLFRAIQEAVSNALRHASASRIDVGLFHVDGAVEVEIRDDGRGFDVDGVRQRALRGEHLGLLGVDERVNSVGGSVRLESAPGRGTVLHVRVPVPE